MEIMVTLKTRKTVTLKEILPHCQGRERYEQETENFNTFKENSEYYEDFKKFEDA